jgi:carboxypeptidase PM20D1
MKSTLVSLMEAAENLCASGFKPKQDIWFAFGGDEERAGTLGAREAANWFARQGQRFSWILDEGSSIEENQIKGIDRPLALVSIEEKGFLSIALSVAQIPGHASQPPRTQAAAVLGRALCRIAAKPFPYRLTPTVEGFFKQAASFVGGAQGFVMRHARALGPFFFRAAASNATVAAMLRTTVALTQLEGSAADNVMPSEARAVINLRLLRPWTVATAMAFIKKAVNDDRVKLSIHGLATEAVAPSGSAHRLAGWPEIESAMAEAWPGIPTLPFLMVATTDSRHYKDLADAIFRFSPHRLDPKEMGGVHGHDERISLDNLNRGLKFYSALFGFLG